jgi:hypothetical protein
MNTVPSRWETSLALLAFNLVFAATTQGELRMTNDSHSYLALAADWPGAYLRGGHATWPPLYAGLLALLPEAFRPAGAWALNGLACLAGLWCWGQIGGKHLPRPLAALWLLGVAVSTELHWFAQYLWSESLFFALWSWMAYGAMRLEDGQGGRGAWLLGGALLALQRHAGLFLLAGHGLWEARRGNWASAAGTLALGIPWLAWAVHAGWWELAQGFGGAYYSHPGEALSHVAQAALAWGDVLARALGPAMLLPAGPSFAAKLLALALMAGALAHACRRRNGWLGWLAGGIAAYWAAYMLVGYSYRIDFLRFMAVAWPGLLLLLFWSWHNISEKWPSWLRLGVPGLWLAYALLRTLHHIEAWGAQ